MAGWRSIWPTIALTNQVPFRPEYDACFPEKMGSWGGQEVGSHPIDKRGQTYHNGSQ